MSEANLVINHLLVMKATYFATFSSQRLEVDVQC